jgi:DNA-binding transcriptional LysR family regulator
VSPELRHLRHFVAVAEELHFTRAAARLHMAQQPLSASIRRLERELGVELLHRTTRRVELTDAGAALLERAREAVRAADAAFDAARATGRGEAGVVAIGVSPGVRYGLDPLFDAIRDRYPRLRVRLRQASSYLVVEDVAAGALDLGIGFCAVAPASLAARRLKDDPVMVTVASDHPLAGRDRVDLTDLREETFALDDPDDGAGYNAAVLTLCSTAGFEPHVRYVHPDFDAWEGAVLRDGCIGLTTPSAVQGSRRGMRILALTPPSTFPVDLLWRPDRMRPALTRVLEVADRLAQSPGAAVDPPPAVKPSRT